MQYSKLATLATRLILLSVLSAPIESIAQDQTEEYSIPRILSTANDYHVLVKEHWGKTLSGNHVSMMIAYHALNNCANFRKAIAAADNVDELELHLATRNPNDILFAKGIYYKCKDLVDNFDAFPEYKRLRMQAALAGNIEARVWMAFEYYRHRNNVSRANIPFSPAAYITEAMAAGNTLVFELTAKYGGAYGLLSDSSTDTSVTWWLVGCRFRGDCDQASSLDVMCHFMIADCLDVENLYDVYRKRATDSASFATSMERADELFLKISEFRFEELGLSLEW